MSDDDELERIAKQIDALDTKDLIAIIKRGELYEQARLGARDDHKRWLIWLKERLATSESTTRRYRNAFRFVRLTNLDVASCNLTAETLFILGNDAYWHKLKVSESARREATDSVLKAAAERKIGRKATLAILGESLGPQAIPQPNAADAPLAPEPPTEGQQESEPDAPPAGRRRRFYQAIQELKALFETPQRLAYQNVPGTRIERSNDTTPEQIAERAKLFANVWPVGTVKVVVDCLLQVNEASLASAGEDFPSVVSGKASHRSRRQARSSRG
jgi:hypothetical protein